MDFGFNIVGNFFGWSDINAFYFGKILPNKYNIYIQDNMLDFKPTDNSQIARTTRPGEEKPYDDASMSIYNI